MEEPYDAQRRPGGTPDHLTIDPAVDLPCQPLGRAHRTGPVVMLVRASGYRIVRSPSACLNMRIFSSVVRRFPFIRLPPWLRCADEHRSWASFTSPNHLQRSGCPARSVRSPVPVSSAPSPPGSSASPSPVLKNGSPPDCLAPNRFRTLLPEKYGAISSPIPVPRLPRFLLRLTRSLRT